MARNGIADDFWWLAHHHATGRPLLHHRVSAHGLAACLLAELLQDQRVVLRDGRVWIRSLQPPVDALAHEVLARIAAERVRHPLSVWVTVLAESSYEQVAERLTRAFQLKRTAPRWRLGRSGWEPTDVNAAGWPSARLAIGVRDRRWLDPKDQLLAALVCATGLDSYVFDGAPPSGLDWLQVQRDHLWLPMAELVRDTHRAVGKAVVAHLA